MTKSTDRYIVNLQDENIKRLVENGEVRIYSDGRCRGISNAVNNAIRQYLGRV